MNALTDQYYADKTEPDGLKNLLRLGLPVLDAEAANKRILDLEVELIKVRAALDCLKLLRDPSTFLKRQVGPLE